MKTDSGDEWNNNKTASMLSLNTFKTKKSNVIKKYLDEKFRNAYTYYLLYLTIFIYIYMDEVDDLVGLF